MLEMVDRLASSLCTCTVRLLHALTVLAVGSQGEPGSSPALTRTAELTKLPTAAPMVGA